MVVDRHARTAELGGDPGMHSLARAYARAVISNRSASYGQIEDSGVWADIYYALRAGDLEAARRLAKDLGSPSLQDFVILLKTYKDNVWTFECSVSSIGRLSSISHIWPRRDI